MQYVNEKFAYATGFSEMLASVLIADDLQEIYADDVFRRLSDLSFDPAKIGNIEDNIQNVDELYLLLIEKKAVRVNAKLTATESTGITLASSEYAPEIGKAIDLTYISKIKYLICEQTIVVYTANLLTNAIIKEFSKTETGTIKILYGDTDSTPMYISYTGHKTPDGAKIESSLIIKDNERTSKYKDALTVNEYYGQEVN